MSSWARGRTDRAVKWENVLLLGDNAVISAGRTWHEAGWKLEWFARGRLVDAEDFIASYEAVNDARSAFYGCARNDLGIKEPEIAAPPSYRYWPQSL